MNLSVGIVGLPNVGKSTLFNALLKKQQALAANYPFATIEPNIGVVPVPDERLDRLADITKTEVGMASLPPIKSALIEFVDIAGLVKGASEGAGLGNKFLSHIREVKVIAHVVRTFEDEDVIKEGAVDPKSDYETIRTELALADLQSLENSKGKIQKANLPAGKAGVQVKNQNEILERIEKVLNDGKPARSLNFADGEQKFVNQLGLLTSKPEIIVLNVSENALKDAEKITQNYADMLNLPLDNFVVISAKVESELSELDSADQKQYLAELGVEKSGLERLIQKAYQQLGLISFLTCGEIEVRAWTIKKNSTAVEAAGEIHTDFMAKFIKAEIVSYNDFVTLGGWKNSRTSGKARLEGRDYVMQDGDVTEFKIGR